MQARISAVIVAALVAEVMTDSCNTSAGKADYLQDGAAPHRAAGVLSA